MQPYHFTPGIGIPGKWLDLEAIQVISDLRDFNDQHLERLVFDWSPDTNYISKLSLASFQLHLAFIDAPLNIDIKFPVLKKFESELPREFDARALVLFKEQRDLFIKAYGDLLAAWKSLPRFNKG